MFYLKYSFDRKLEDSFPWAQQHKKFKRTGEWEFSWFTAPKLFDLTLINCLQEAVGDTLEELWISYNSIEKLKGIHVLKKLKVSLCYIPSNIFPNVCSSTVKLLQTSPRLQKPSKLYIKLQKFLSLHSFIFVPVFPLGRVMGQRP